MIVLHIFVIKVILCSESGLFLHPSHCLVCILLALMWDLSFSIKMVTVILDNFCTDCRISSDGLRVGVYPLGCQQVSAAGPPAALEHEDEHLPWWGGHYERWWAFTQTGCHLYRFNLICTGSFLPTLGICICDKMHQELSTRNKTNLERRDKNCYVCFTLTSWSSYIRTQP